MNARAPETIQDCQGGALLRVRVTPRARRDDVSLDDDGTVRVYVSAPPEDGKANAAVCALLAKTLRTPKGAVTVARGLRGRDKALRVAAMSAREIARRLGMRGCL